MQYSKQMQILYRNIDIHLKVSAKKPCLSCITYMALSHENGVIAYLIKECWLVDAS